MELDQLVLDTPVNGLTVFLIFLSTSVRPIAFGNLVFGSGLCAVLCSVIFTALKPCLICKNESLTSCPIAISTTHLLFYHDWQDYRKVRTF